MNILNICKQQYKMHLQPLGHPDVSETQMHLTASVSDSRGRAGTVVHGYVY